jgi:hypothetical protein
MALFLFKIARYADFCRLLSENRILCSILRRYARVNTFMRGKMNLCVLFHRFMREELLLCVFRGVYA